MRGALAIPVSILMQMPLSSVSVVVCTHRMLACKHRLLACTHRERACTQCAGLYTPSAGLQHGMLAKQARRRVGSDRSHNTWDYYGC